MLNTFRRQYSTVPRSPPPDAWINLFLEPGALHEEQRPIYRDLKALPKAPTALRSLRVSFTFYLKMPPLH